MRIIIEDDGAGRYDNLQPCPKCGKEMGIDEYVVNWGLCSDCLDKDYSEYLKKHPDVATCCDTEF